MYDSEVSSEYDLQPCQACLSFNRKLTMVGDLVDVFRKICDNSPMLSVQTNVCWECLALLKKVRAFKRKVESAQKILDYCIDKQIPQDSLSDLTTTFTETTTFVPILIDDDELEEEDELGQIKIELLNVEEYVDLCKEEEEEQTLFKIEDVRGRCDIVDTKPFLDLSSGSSEVSPKPEPAPAEAEAEAERRRRGWQRAALLVYQRLRAHEYACHFARPVSDALAPGYSRAVRRPMDLGTIKRNIRDGRIRNTAELRRDLLLMFSNALVYNSSHHAIYHMALAMRQEALRELKLLVAAQAHAVAQPAPRRR